MNWNDILGFEEPIRLDRRTLLKGAACGFGYLAFAGLCAASRSPAAQPGPLAPKTPHHPPRAKRVIFLFMHGGPSQMDTFDYKPRLNRESGQPCPLELPNAFGDDEKYKNKKIPSLLGSPWAFRQHGQSGLWVSDLLPETATCADDLCVIRSLHTEGQAHGEAILRLHTGASNLVRPSVGSWVTYGLGSENENLPGFVTWSEENPSPGGNDESASKGQFGFSNFPDGRRYAELLTSFFRAGEVGYEDLGRLAQDALYYHAGSKAPIPQDSHDYTRRLSISAAIRKTGPWVVCLSGLISTQAINNQYYLDRQGHLSVYHTKTGLIITGANSKRQPELATFSEKLLGQAVHMPISSRLDMVEDDMGEKQDRLSLAYNTFFSELYMTKPSEKALSFRFAITGRGRPADDPRLTLQLCLKHGEILETATGRKITLGRDRIELSPDDLGGWIRHHGWRLKFDPTARLVWPVYPHHPYTDAPEKGLDHAVGALSVPLRLKAVPGHYVRPGEQEIQFVVEVN